MLQFDFTTVTYLCRRNGPVDLLSPQTSDIASQSGPQPPQEPLLSGTSWGKKKKRAGQSGRDRDETQKRVSGVSLSKNCLDWSVVQAGVQNPRESAVDPVHSSPFQPGVYYSSLFGGLISWPAHQSVTERQKCWGSPRQQTDHSLSSLKSEWEEKVRFSLCPFSPLKLTKLDQCSSQQT